MTLFNCILDVMQTEVGQYIYIRTTKFKYSMIIGLASCSAKRLQTEREGRDNIMVQWKELNWSTLWSLLEEIWKFLLYLTS